MTLPVLINTNSTFETVRDAIAQILSNETANQMALAALAALDPEEWNMVIYMERFTPIESQLNNPGLGTPIVNVSWDSSSFSAEKSNLIERRHSTGLYNIDVYGFGAARPDGLGGHVPGDVDTALRLQRAVRLVQQIIMSPEHIYLGMQGLVSRRWISSINAFQPDQGSVPVQNVMAARLSFEVDFNEFSIQSSENNLLNEIGITVIRDADGAILASADF